MTKKGFTLIELLIVIGILAVLATATALILNPAELLRQSRDSKRIADLSALQSATDVFLYDNATNGLFNISSVASKGTWPNATAWPTLSKASTPTADVGGCPATGCTTANQANDGTGWVPVNFASVSSGGPISRLPIDPANGTVVCDPANGATPVGACFYQYIFGSNNKYEYDTSMESVKYRKGGPGDVESTDGGDNDNAYEVGNNLKL